MRSSPELQTAAAPLIDVAAGLQPCAAATLTAFGRRVLSGRDDHASVNGLDRWVGGVHLCGTSPRWRVTIDDCRLTIAD